MNFPMMYSIGGLCPTGEMSGAGFGIALYPGWKEQISLSGYTQENMDNLVQRFGKIWLRGCLNIEEKDFELYKHDVRIAWGEWGPEHISVPGNACGLDICDTMSAPIDGKYLSPHNVDTVNQAHMLLTIFTTISSYVIGEMVYRGIKKGNS